MIPATSVVERDLSALIVIDIQNRLAASMERRVEVTDRVALLLRVARITGVPVFITRQYPKGLGDTVPELEAIRLGESPLGLESITLDKMTFDCFKEGTFTDAITTSMRRQLIICGMETHICVTQTVLAGLREGYDVHVVGDACCSQRTESHELALGRMGNAGAVVTTAESVAYELVGEAGTSEFKELLAAVKASSTAP